MSREKRKILAQATLDIMNSGEYLSEGNVLVDIKAEIQFSTENTRVYSSEELNKLVEIQELKTSDSIVFNVTNEDVVSCVNRVKKENDSNIMCLNFASAKNPGGGFLNGAIAQEESLAFSSNLYACQIKTDGYYNLHKSTKSCVYSDTMIYSPSVVFFRGHDGALENDPVVCNVITSAAVNKGVVKQREIHLIDSINTLMKVRIDKMLALANTQKNNILILGAWGCGVFQNDPVDIAELFSELLRVKYKNVFKKVVFAIYSKNEKFIKAFEKEFKA